MFIQTLIQLNLRRLSNQHNGKCIDGTQNRTCVLSTQPWLAFEPLLPWLTVVDAITSLHRRRKWCRPWQTNFYAPGLFGICKRRSLLNLREIDYIYTVYGISNALRKSITNQYVLTVNVDMKIFAKCWATTGKGFWAIF